MLYVIGAAVAALLLLILLFRTVWRVAEPNEALIISGLGAHGEASAEDSRGFKIVVGRGTAVIPGFQTVRRLPLGTKSTGLIVNAVSNQSIPLTVKGIVAFKVGDDQGSIRNAARRFLEQKDELMLSTIHELFAGHLRAIVGGMTVEDMLHNREELTANIRSSLADDLGKLGLVVDSLQIQEIDDESGYIANLGKPQAAAIESKARIAAAQRDQEATEAEQAADAAKAAAVRQSAIAQAGYQAEVDQAKAEAAQSGPLAEAKARQEVVRAETETAQLDAARREKMLESEVRKPADAEAYRQVTLANAEREAKIAGAEAQAKEQELRGVAQAKATEATGAAEAKAIEAKALAEAAGIKARAAALAENQDAVIAQTIAEQYPEIVRAGASALGNIDNLVVLNGADGMEDLLGKALTMGGAGLGLAQRLIQTIRSDSAPTTQPAAPAAPAVVQPSNGVAPV
ncbi:MAG TPA: SPFH domain-containing protein [Nocardioidaceae bacterium]|nr:SPFH domain-containing protein [Nocardioidaceae bacterium]